MGELLNFSDIEFLEYFCRSGNVVTAFVVGALLVTFGVHRRMENRDKK